MPPRLTCALIGLHLYLVTKLGISAPPWLKPEPDDADHPPAEEQV